MSAALVRKSLQLIDDHSEIKDNSRKNRRKSNNPIKISVTTSIQKQGRKDTQPSYLKKPHILKEVYQQLATERNKEAENSAKFKSLHTKVDLDEETALLLLERARTGRAVPIKKKKYVVEKTAFTEEDFKKFEEEYIDE